LVDKDLKNKNIIYNSQPGFMEMKLLKLLFFKLTWISSLKKLQVWLLKVVT